MDYKEPNVFSKSTESFPIEDRNISEYKKVYHILDELGFNNLKGQFSEHQIQVNCYQRNEQNSERH